jgi:tetraacyldisaccharide 4'-kinase
LDDLKEIKKSFSKIKGKKKIIITTEKDGVRLAKYEKELREMPVYVFPIAHEFLFEQERDFEKEVLQYIESFKKM